MQPFSSRAGNNATSVTGHDMNQMSSKSGVQFVGKAQRDTSRE